MELAFEFAYESLHRRGVNNPPRDAIATAIVGLAQAGERDPDRLCNAAVEACRRILMKDSAAPEDRPDF